MLEKIKATANFIKEKIKAKPEIGIILGTGLGGLVKEIEIVYNNRLISFFFCLLTPKDLGKCKTNWVFLKCEVFYDPREGFNTMSNAFISL